MPAANTANTAYTSLAPHGPLLEYRGTLLHSAEARVRVEGQAPALPVLRFDLAIDHGHHNTLHVEQPWPVGQFDQCSLAAKRLKKGMHLTVQAPLQGMHLTALNAAHIAVTHSTATATATGTATATDNTTSNLFQEP